MSKINLSISMDSKERKNLFKFKKTNPPKLIDYVLLAWPKIEPNHE
jgi:hypothetical protein